LRQVDLPRRRRIVDALLGIRDQLGVPLIYVTHLPEEALAVADWAVLIDNGRILAEGPPKQTFESFDAFGAFARQRSERPEHAEPAPTIRTFVTDVMLNPCYDRLLAR
jgi:ABC-type molybdate transport system ATPase subunit